MTTIVIPGIGGQQQAAIATAFRAAGWTVRGTRRTPAPGTTITNLETGEGLAEAFRGADAIVLTPRTTAPVPPCASPPMSPAPPPRPGSPASW